MQMTVFYTMPLQRYFYLQGFYLGALHLSLKREQKPCQCRALLGSLANRKTLALPE